MEHWEQKTLSNTKGIVESFLCGLIIWLLFFLLNIFLKILIPSMSLMGFSQFLWIQIICASYIVFYVPYMNSLYRKKLLLEVKRGDKVELVKNSQIKVEVLEMKLMKKHPQKIKFHIRNLLNNETSWVDSKEVYISNLIRNKN